MDKKKPTKEKKKHSLRKNTLSKAQKENNLSFLNQMKEQGLEKLFLSPLTQKVLECRIGEDLTVDNRWVFVKKEKIEDNMFLHDNSSEFLPIKKKIEDYPEPEILIGSYSHIQDKETDFFVCTTVDVKNDVLSVIETEKRTAYKRMWNLLHPISKPWINLGSEVEVDDCLSKNFRSPFEVILDTEYPIPYHHSKFTMCFVEDIPNSYIEILGGRFRLNLVFRKRVNKSTQSTLPHADKSMQSKLAVLKNKYIQYAYDCKESEISEEVLEKLKTFFFNKCDHMYETLLVNFNINLFNDDYKELAINDKGLSFRDPIELRSYQDVMNCKHKKVSCVSWNAFVSGMVAVAYVSTPIHYIGKHEPIHNDAEDTVHEKHLVLLWTYQDNVRPKLYIHAYREVTALSFCPYDENVLIGGYSNGQIVVWDLKNRIAAVEFREVLNQMEEKHRDIMTKQTAWIKPALGVEHVFPTITSLFENSHRSVITSIKWIPPTHFISKLGVYEQTPPDEEHMQFYSISLNGSTIQVWDLKPQQEKKDKKAGKKRTQRLSKLPPALSQTESLLKKLQPDFIPRYRLRLKEAQKGLNNPLISIIAKNQLYEYVAFNPSTISNIEKQTLFQMNGLLKPFDDATQLILTSALGNLSVAKWTGSTYSQGLAINSETCTLSNFADVHDGPIVACEVNPFLQDVLLTTGGSVFAIWECKKLNVPLVWRKCHSHYIAGMWSFRHPLTLFMTRSDSHFEIWNILEKSESPVRSFRYKGNQLLSVFNDRNRLHALKETFITTDMAGAIKVFHLASGIVQLKDNFKEDSIAYINTMITIKQITENLKLKVKMKQATTVEPVKQEEEPQVPQPVVKEPEPRLVKLVPQAQVENVASNTPIGKWQRRLEQRMHHVLMEKKNLNIEEIERNRIPMQEIMTFEKKKQQQIEYRIATREENFKKMKDTILVPIEKRKIRRKITINLSKEMVKNLKQTYFENFKTIEAETLEKIKCNRFKFILNWNQMLQFGIFNKKK